MAKEYPADACGAICLSFRALAKLSETILPNNLEMIHLYKNGRIEQEGAKKANGRDSGKR
jgi:hypothetical protein